MKKILIPLLLSAFILASCSGAETAFSSETEDQNAVSETSTLESQNSEAPAVSITAEEETGPEESSTETTVDENTEVGGGDNMCQEHTFSYHSIPGRLIDLVGEANFHNWIDSLPNDTHAPGYVVERFSIVDFVDQFNVSKEDFLEATRSWMTDEAMGRLGVTREEYQETYGYTDAQIDAIYSGDQSQINEAFCGDLAYYNPSDGQLYSIYWLSDHTAADYQAAGVPVSEVERILDDASAMGGSYASLAEAAAPAAEAGGGSLCP